jgi:hypothetical protein
MDTPRTSPKSDRDPRPAEPGADEGGIKTGESPHSPVTPGGVAGEGETEDQADPSLSIEDVNHEPHDGGMIGEGGH